MKEQYIFIFTVFLLAACSSTYLIKDNDTSYTEMNKKLEGEKVTLELLNGAEITGFNVEVKSDSTSVGDHNLPTTSINKITNTNHSKGAFTGLSIGALITAPFGFLVGYNSSDKGWSGIGGIAGAIVVGGMGAFTGLFIGAINGESEIFIFPPQAKEFKPSNHVEFTKIVKKGRGYIIILWQSKDIKLLSEEYNYMVFTDDGKQFIVVPKEIYESKFN